MQTVILCGGQGTRLKEETEYKPKPMVRIGTRPILWHIMQIYARSGYSEFLLALGFKGNVIRDYFLNYEVYNNDFTVRLGHYNKDVQFHSKLQEEADWKVTLVETGEKALTGTRIKRCEKYIKGDLFFATYGDGLADIDIRKLLEFHKRHGKIATLTGVNPPSRWGELAADRDRIINFKEKPPVEGGERYVSGGFFVFHRRVFDYISPDEDCILENRVLEKLAEDGELMLYRHDGGWQAMDNYRDYLYLNDLWNNGKAFWNRK